MSNKIDINRLNYEEFVIDYLDGNLHHEELECLLSFLNNNPDIKEEVNELNQVNVVADSEVFINKDSIKKSVIVSYEGIDEDHYEDHFIAYREHDLTHNQINKLESFIKLNPQLKNEFITHGKLKIYPDINIVFAPKNKLKKRQIPISYWYSAAAMVVIMLTSLWYFPYQEQNDYRDSMAYVSHIVLKDRTINITNDNVSDKPYEKDIEFVQILDQEIDDNILKPEESLVISRISPKHNRSSITNEHDYAYTIEDRINNDISITTATSLLIAENNNEKPKQKSLFTSVIYNQLNKLTAALGRNKHKKNTSSPDPTYVKVIDKGILVFNTITGSETYTAKTYDVNGELTSYKVEGKEVLRNRNASEESAN
jgi:hypothetical protein